VVSLYSIGPSCLLVGSGPSLAARSYSAYISASRQDRHGGYIGSEPAIVIHRVLECIDVPE
jgi:hypothetical protein